MHSSHSAITIVIHGIPTAWARMRLSGKFHFPPAKQREAGNVIQQIAANEMSGRHPLDGPLSVTITAIWCWPKSLSYKKRCLPGAKYKTSRPDSDNVAKLIRDRLNGVCYRDDAQIVELTVNKIFGDTASTIVTISPLAEGDANE